MTILNTKFSSCGRGGVFPRIVYIETDDTLSAITSTGYLNDAVNRGDAFQENDAVLVSSKTSPTATSSEANWFEVSISGNDYSLKAIGSPGSVTPPITANTLARYNGVNGQSQDSGISVASGNQLTGLGGLAVDNVDVDGNVISSLNTNGDVTYSPDGAGAVDAQSDTVKMTELTHAGDTDNKIALGSSTIDLQTGGSSRLDISNSGIRMGGANARITTILDEDNMSSDSATALITQQSAKAYVDGLGGGTDDTYVSLSGDFTTSSTSAVDITGLSFTPDADTDYIIMIKLLVQTNNDTYGASCGVEWPTGLDDGSCALYLIDSSAIADISLTSTQWLNIPTTLDTTTAYGECPNAAESFLCYGVALLMAGATPSGDFKLQCRAENVAQTLTIKAGSFIRYEAYS